MPAQEFAHIAQSGDGSTFGAISFGGDLQSAIASFAMPVAHVAMPTLNADESQGSAYEIWRSKNKLFYGRRHDISYAHDEELLFGVIQLAEEKFEPLVPANSGKTPLQLAAESAYRQIFDLLAALRFPHVLRFWNYIADINGESHGLERYRQFNIGRQDGFLHSGRHIAGSAVPAASALGCDQGPLTVYFFAGRTVFPNAIENPRQVSAYQYPAQYGPRSPTFSRASMIRLNKQGGKGKSGQDILFISGTASIVGHRTLHEGDAAAQTRETLANINALVCEAGRLFPEARFSMQDLIYKVYVRHAQDAPAIRDELQRALGSAARMLFLKADICRKELVVEIEASAGHPLEFAI